MDKDTLRKKLKQERLQLSPPKHAELSQKACTWLMQSSLWQKSHSIALYISVNGELDTSYLIKEVLEHSTSKKILLPFCTEEKCEMKLVPFTCKNNLTVGKFGIPVPQQIDNCEESIPELIVMPLLGFDRNGTRLGYGGGYYDRLCSRTEFKTVLRIGLAFSFQEQEFLPQEPWDMPLHGVCTENGLHYFVKNLPTG